MSDLGNIDVVYDNCSKGVEQVEEVVRFARHKGVGQLLYVSSAGTYQYDEACLPHIEGDSSKGGQIQVEDYLFNKSSIPSLSFRPIYIIGNETMKREYTDYFFDRIVEGKPVLIPGCGEEFTSITSVDDVAGMLALSLGRTDLKGEVFNVTSPRAITMDGFARMCGRVVGKEVEIVHYDPKRITAEGFVVKKAFPFRPRHFFADPGKAMHLLGWQPDLSNDKQGLEKAVKICYDEYLKRSLDKSEKSFDTDKMILEAIGLAPVAVE